MVTRFKSRCPRRARLNSSTDNKAVIGFLSECSSIDESLLDSLPAPDFFRLRAALKSLIFGITGTGERTGESPLNSSEKSAP